MPFWSKLIRTGPEVDDDELPLAKHRLYDDDGNLKDERLPSINLDALLSKMNAKKVPSMTPKQRAALIKKHTGITIQSHSLPSKKKHSVSEDEEEEHSDEEKSSAPRSARSSVSHGRPSNSRTTPTKRGRSPSPTSSRTPSRVSNTPVPTKSTSPAQKPRGSARSSAGPRKSSSPPRQRSVSPRKSKGAAKVAPSPISATKKRGGSTSRGSSIGRTSQRVDGAPSPLWTAAEMRSYAKAHNIDVRGLRLKADLMSVISPP